MPINADLENLALGLAKNIELKNKEKKTLLNNLQKIMQKIFESENTSYKDYSNFVHKINLIIN